MLRDEKHRVGFKLNHLIITDRMGGGQSYFQRDGIKSQCADIIKKSYAYSARSEHPAHGPTG